MTRTTVLEAMDDWTAAPGQNTPLVKQAIATFQRFEENAPSASLAVLRDWQRERELFEDYDWKGNNPIERNKTAAETGFIRWCFPWELVRLKRVQDAIFSRSLDKMQIVERDLRNRGFVDPQLTESDRLAAPWKFERTTLEPPNEAPGYGIFLMPTSRVNSVAIARLHFLAWATVDYEREHHKLPATLQELVPQYFAWLPVDPWAGRNFAYLPKGAPLRIKSLIQTFDRNQPFIASAGQSDCRLEINPPHNPQGAPPVRIVTSGGLPLNDRLTLEEPIEFAVPAVGIPGRGSRTWPGAKSNAAPAQPPGKLFGKPAPKQPTAKGPTQE
jgi:hypothetical protein